MSTEFIDEDMLSGFYVDTEETFYPQVAQGLDDIRAGKIPDGIDVLLRPLHTIKGTSGFLGLEDISRYTHKVEDYLKAVQGGEVQGDVRLLTRAVDMVFTLMELSKSGKSLTEADHMALTDELDVQLGGPGKVQNRSSTRMLELADLSGTPCIRVQLTRVHLPSQYSELIKTLEGFPPGTKVAVDLTSVRTMGSAAWGALRVAAEHLDISVIGLSDGCRSIFFSWGFDRMITTYADRDQFLNRNSG